MLVTEKDICSSFIPLPGEGINNIWTISKVSIRFRGSGLNMIGRNSSVINMHASTFVMPTSL